MKGEQKIGEWAFLGGMALAVVIGLGTNFLDPSSLPIVWAILALLGIIVGFMNIREKEMNSFLIATIAFLVVANSIAPIESVFAGVPAGLMLVKTIGGFLSALAVFVSPAAFIVALKAIYTLAKTE
jgi:hypothetical protein